MKESCPVCHCLELKKIFHQNHHNRDFYQCLVCDLRFVPREQILKKEVEKSRYENHKNTERSIGYEKFLRRLINPIKANFTYDDLGLDFGSGPYPMLQLLMKEDGFKNIDIYDPFFAPDDNVFNKKYDFITLCEVFEHMEDPISDLSKILDLLSSNSLLIISTGIFEKNLIFDSWYYIKDETHINFFSNECLHWIALKLNLEIEILEKDLVIIRKNKRLL